MSEKMLVTQALDERDLLVKKITDKIAKANNIINIDHQLLRDSSSKKYIQSTKTNAGTRKLPIKEDVAEYFKRLIADRLKVEFEKMLDGYAGFLCIDETGEPLVAMHWEHRFNHMVGRYNSIFKVQMPNITPHVCRHTYCTNQAKAGMNPKTLQYLMGHSEIGVTLNTYTHLGLEDAAEEMKRMQKLEEARKEMYGETKEKPMKQNMFKADWRNPVGLFSYCVYFLVEVK